MANGKQLSQEGAEEILDILDSYIDVKEAVTNKDTIIRLLGERCNQLLKDKGDLTDKIIELETKLKEFDMLRSDNKRLGKILKKTISDRDRNVRRREELKEQIEKMKCYMNCDYSTHPDDCPVLKKKKKTECNNCAEWRLKE